VLTILAFGGPLLTESLEAASRGWYAWRLLLSPFLGFF